MINKPGIKGAKIKPDTIVCNQDVDVFKHLPHRFDNIVVVTVVFTKPLRVVKQGYTFHTLLPQLLPANRDQIPIV
jgi:hypothetical protein